MGIREAVKAYRSGPARNDPQSAVEVSTNALDKGRVGKPNAQRYRNWAERSEWIRAAINVRKNQVSQSDWDIIPFDSEGADPDPALQRAIKAKFQSPNPRNDSWRSFIEPVIEDILVLDAGVIEKERTVGGELVGLWPVNAAKVKVDALWAGDEKSPRYYYYRDPNGINDPVQFLNEDLIYMMESSSTYRVVGLSKLETLQMTVEAELAGHLFNNRQVTNAAPDGMLDLGEGARPEQVSAFKSYWDAEVSGRGAMAFVGGTKNAKFVPFRNGNREMQFMEWQLYLVRKICAVFGLSPQDIAITDSLNRATADIQAEQTEDRGLRPLLGLLQEYLTQEIVWDPTFGGPENNLAFRFTRLNLKESLSRAQINQRALAGISWKTPNEARRQDGLQPMEGEQYDSLIALTSAGIVSLADIPTAREALERRSSQTPEPAAAGNKSIGD